MWIVAVRKALPQEHLLWQAASLCTPRSGDYTASRLCKLLHWLFLKQCTMWGWNQSVYLIFPKQIFSWPLVWIVVVRKTSPGEYLLWEAASLCTPQSGDHSVSTVNSLVVSLVGVCKDQDHVARTTERWDPDGSKNVPIQYHWCYVSYEGEFKIPNGNLIFSSDNCSLGYLCRQSQCETTKKTVITISKK